MKIKKRREPVNLLSLGDDEPVVVPAELAGPEPQPTAAPDLAPDPEPDLEPEPEVELGFVFRKQQAGFSTPPAALLADTAAAPALAEPPPRAPAVLTPPAQAITDIAPPPAWPIWAAAFGASVLALAPIAFAWGYRDATEPLTADVLARTVFFVLAFLPAVFIWAGAWLFRQGQLLAAETQRTRAMAAEMVAPAALAAGEVSELTSTLREDISAAADAARSAQDSLASLRHAFAEESRKLAEAAGASVRSARELAHTIAQERVQMSGLSQHLGVQAEKVAEAIAQQAKMVSEASDLAETQLREAEASLTSRAADLAAAAGQAGDVARVAGEDLTRHIARLESAGLGVADQVRASEQGLAEQRAALMTIAHALRADHSAFAAEAESQAAQLSNFMLDARQTAREMGERASETGEALRRLVAEASEQFTELAQTAWNEREAFSERATQSLGVVAEAAAAERERLQAQAQAAVEALGKAVEQTQAAAARHAQTAREQVDQLSEAAFVAGQKANQLFETRLGEARALIEGSAQLVEQAGAETARKLETGATAAREALGELTTMLAEIDRRTAELPVSARRQAQEVREAVAESIEALIGQARRTAEETQALDGVFQDRVRRNYEMLSQAVQLMGAVTGAATQTPTPPPLKPAPAPEARLEPQPEAKAEPAPPPPPPEITPAKLGLRPRLRLTPTATDQEFTQVFEAASGTRPEEPAAPMSGSDGWTWKELLSSIEDSEAGAALDAEGELDAERLLTGEIVRMGIDPESLLPARRIDELAAVIQTGDVDGAREVVGKLAAAATRRLSRRIHSDGKVKAAAAKYVADYRSVLAEAAQRDPSGEMVATLLNTPSGRTWLLTEASAPEFA